MHRPTSAIGLLGALLLLSFGGAAPSFAASAPPTLARWSSIHKLPGTSIRSVFDAGQHRVIVIPEFTQVYWVLDTHDPAAGWAVLPTQGPAPPGHTGGAVVMDPIHRRVIVWGGYTFTPGPDPNYYVLDLSTEPATWSAHTAGGPAPRKLRNSGAIYDHLRDRIVFFGGAWDSLGARFVNDVWTLTIGPASSWWTPLAIPGNAPTPRYDGAAIYDPLRDQLVVHGGMDVLFGGPRSDAWALNFTGPMQWTRLWQGAGGREGQRSHHGFYDASRDCMLLMGGTDSSSGYNANYHDDVRALPLGTPGAPTLIADETGAPHNMGTFAAAYDQETRAIFTLGDEHNPGAPAVTWRFDLDPTTWTRLFGPTASVLERFGQAQAWDASGQRMIFTGGRNTHYVHFDFYTDYYDETRSLTMAPNPIWGSLDSGGYRPPSRQYATLLADPAADRMWLFGGNHTTVQWRDFYWIEVFANLWCLDLGAGTPVWTGPEVEGVQPASRDGHTAVLDTRRHRMIVFGGRSSTILNDVWALSLDAPHTWTNLSPAGGPPPGRYFHVAGYDSLEDRMLVYGGIDLNNAALLDLWSLSLSGTPTWTQLATSGTPPPTLDARPAFFDPVRRRMVVIGKGISWQGPTPTTPIFVLSFDQPVPDWTEIPSTGEVKAERSGRSAAIDPGSGEIVLLWGAGYREPAWDVEALPSRITFDEVPVPTAVSPPVFPSRVMLEAPTPNPARSAFRIYAALPSAQAVTVDLLDASGRAVQTRRLAAGAHHVDAAFSTAGLAPGLYFVRVAQAAETATRKVVVMK